MFLSVGCGGGGDGDSDTDGDAPPDNIEERDGEEVEPTGACVRDPALLAEQRACRRDDHCPCGAHCTLGRCLFDCKADGDCAGGWCDAFGRCRALDDAGVIPPVEEGKEGVLRVAPSHVPVFVRDGVRPVKLTAGGRALENLRLQTTDGLLVDCGSGFARECAIASVPAGDEGVTVALRIDDAGTPGTAWRLDVFYGGQVRSVSLALFDAPAGGAMRPGKYRGTAWIGSASARVEGEVPSSAAVLETTDPMIEVPIEARRFDDGTLVLLCTRGVMPRTWVFTMAGDGSFDAVDGSTDGALVALIDPAANGADTTAAEVTVTGSGRLVETDTGIAKGSLEMVVGGLGLGLAPLDGVDERMRLAWNLSLARAGDLDAGDVPGNYAQVDPAPVFAADRDRYADDLPWSGRLAGAAIEPRGGGFSSWIQKMQLFLCYQREVGSETDPVSSPFGSTVETALRDYACDLGTSSDRIVAFPFFSLDASATAAVLLDGCLEDLQKAGEAPPAGGCGTDDVNCLTGYTRAADDPPTCVDAPLVLRAMSIGLAQMERQGWPSATYWEPNSVPAVRMAHRLVQQWLQLLTFVAREPNQANDLRFLSEPPDLAAALDASLDGWNVVLHPRVAGRLLHLPDAVLDEPDYRAGETQVSLDYAQGAGIPVVMLETLRAQLEAATTLLERTRFGHFASLPPQVARALRYAAVVLPMARLVHGRAAADGAPAWEPLWQESEKNLAAALGRILEQWNGYDRGESPLGIEEDDVPLYHGAVDVNDAIDRFKAVSDYLLAAGGGATDPGWATTAVQNALDSKANAQAVWEALLERQLQHAMDAEDADDRAAQMKRNYGEKILDLCGNDMFGGTVMAEDVLDELAAHPEITPYNCFLSQENAACRFDEEEIKSKLTTDDVGYRLCVLAGLNQGYGDRVEFENDYANEFVDRATESIDSALSEGAWTTLSLGMSDIALDAWNMVQISTDWSQFLTDQHLTVEGGDDGLLSDTEEKCQALYPDAVPMSKFTAELESSPLDSPDCYRGTLGELALAVRAAGKDIEIANAELDESTDLYDIAVRGCVMKETALAAREDVQEALQGTADMMEGTKRTIDRIFSVVDGVKGCICGSGIDTITMCANSLVGVGLDHFKGYADTVPLDELQASHDEMMALIESDLADAECFNDAEMHLVGADANARRVEKSRLDLAQALLRLDNAREELKRLVFEGTSRVQAEEERTTTSLVNATWNDLWDLGQGMHEDAVEKYRRDMRIARRGAYLAVRAVEYEWQMTLAVRQTVLRATDPQELEDVLDGLRNELAPNTILGQSPENIVTVLSLKEQLMQLQNREGWPDGEMTLTDTERLRLILTSPRFAYYDKGGAYLGQLIPFTVEPLGTIGLGETGGIPLLTGSDCAERIWAVNVVLQGTGLVDGSTTKSRVDLLQRNTFHSQWCAERAPGSDPLQNISVRPSHNLFTDPVWGGVSTSTATIAESEFIRARVDAYHNVSRADFEAEGYSQGGSTELACRGLYGDFALFFDKNVLAVGASGLRLENIDDILIRFDYVSVAKTW